MGILIKFIKWIMNVVMIFTLLGGIGCVIFAGTYLKILPASVDELAPTVMTVKTLLIGAGVQMLTPQEYPTQIEVPNAPKTVEGVSEIAVMPDVKATDSKLLIRVGDKVSVYLRKENVKQLESKTSVIPPVMIGYGITLQNGTVLSDPKETISDAHYRDLKRTGYHILLVPIIYFLLLIFYNPIRRKIVNTKAKAP